MTKIGNKPIIIPSKINIFYDEEHKILNLTGTNGSIAQKIPTEITINLNSNLLFITSNKKNLQGLFYVLMTNHIIGLTNFFKIKVLTQGLGYKFILKNNQLLVLTGCTNTQIVQIPINIHIKQETPFCLHIWSINKQELGQFVAILKKLKKRNIYTGNGIYAETDIFNLKPGKTRK